ncbi:IL-6 subfamily cytokine M17 isoform X2 [Esox lucius]|uniref:IL-6 subfamily cytokine M17 isoform X2 n=1 Tax=Esox lucius TaxID=8010 RepID=UPI000577D413|nr:IL-6 subfamily cytokine M17 isoform X2 [Esox lucius]
MSGHVKIMYPQVSISPTARTWLSLMLVVAIHPSDAGAACGNTPCGPSLQRSLKLTRLMHKESGDLLKTYASQGDQSDLFCQKSSNIVPDPIISGLDPSERILSIYSHCKTFLPHLTRVTEQQTDLQPPSSPLLNQLLTAQNRISGLGNQINCLYQTLFPNLPIPPEPVDGPMSVPPPQNVFQQKIYGCVVLKRFKEFLANSARELKTIKDQMCSRRKTFGHANALF